jgi:hypothetical protein
MGNAIRGTVTCEIDGERLELLLATNEWCELEDEFGKTTDEILAEFFKDTEAQKLKMQFLRRLFLAALSSSKPEMTLEEAGTIMTRLGLVEAATLLGRTIVASLPKAEAAPAGAPGKPKARPARKP